MVASLKGTTSSEDQAVLIAVSRGALSYIVKLVEDQNNNLWSLARSAVTGIF